MGNITDSVSTQGAMAFALRVHSRMGVLMGTERSATLMVGRTALEVKAFLKGIDW